MFSRQSGSVHSGIQGTWAAGAGCHGPMTGPAGSSSGPGGGAGAAGPAGLGGAGCCPAVAIVGEFGAGLLDGEKEFGD